MKIIKPIIIIGTGRSGSTIFYKIFSEYDKLSWISNLANSNPNDLRKHRLFLKGLDFSLFNSLLLKNFRAGEGYKFWDYYCKGFSTPCRDLRKEDLSSLSKKKVIEGFGHLLTKSRKRLLLKITGWPRITFLKTLFPDAKFIHVIRDGRAVANSLINVHFWWGWRGPSNWRWGELSKEYETEWLKYNKSFIALAAIEWKIIMDAVELSRRELNDSNFLEIKYEDLCENPIDEFQKVFKFSELELTPRFKKIINNTNFRNTNFKWERELNEKQKEILTDVLNDYLVKYGYK